MRDKSITTTGYRNLQMPLVDVSAGGLDLRAVERPVDQRVIERLRDVPTPLRREHEVGVDHGVPGCAARQPAPLRVRIRKRRPGMPELGELSSQALADRNRSPLMALRVRVDVPAAIAPVRTPHPAEGVGFEPTRTGLSRSNGFQDRLFRPLRQPSRTQALCRTVSAVGPASPVRRDVSVRRAAPSQPGRAGSAPAWSPRGTARRCRTPARGPGSAAPHGRRRAGAWRFRRSS